MLKFALFLALLTLAEGHSRDKDASRFVAGKDGASDDFECWKASPGIHYTGKGLDKTKDVNEVEGCMSLCRSTPGCDVIDVDSATNPHCWIKLKNFQTTVDELKPLGTNTNYMSDQGCLDLIEGLDHPCWTVYTRVHYPGLQQVNEDYIGGCLDECEDAQDCAVVDWDFKTNPKCWNQKRKFQVSTNSHKPHKTVVNFILDRECYQETKEADLSIWRVTSGYYYAGKGLDQVNIATRTDCLNECLKSDNCGAVDWDTATNPHCWIHKKGFTATTKDLRVKKTVTNYMRIFARWALFKGLDLRFWRVRWGYQYDNLKLTPATNFKECFDACQKNSACFVLTWLTAESKCYVQDDGNGRVNEGRVRRVANAVTLFAKRNRLLQFRKSFGINFGTGVGVGLESELAPGNLVSLGGVGLGAGVGSGVGLGAGTGMGLGIGSDHALGNLVSLGGVGGHAKFKFKDLGCRRNPFCLKLVKSVRTVRRYWRFKFGFFYKGLKEVAAKDIKECIESCQFSPSCFVTTWTEDNKCYVQQDGDVNLKPDNLEVRPNALTFLARMKLLNRFRLTGSDQDTGGDDDDSGDDSHSGDDDHSGDAATKFGGFGCQGNLLCSKLFRKVGLGKLRKWRLKYGSFYKGLKEVPAKDARDCVENCQFHLKCFVASWTEDNKCHIQQDGDGKLNPANLETRPNAYTFLGRKNRLLRYRKGRVGHSGDKDISKDIARKTGGFGCQNDQNCWNLLKLVGRARKLYKARFGILYKGLKEVPAKDIKECVDNCGSNEKCFVLSWTEDKKCHLQQDGNGVLNQGNFEPNKNTLTLVGKAKHLQRFRKFGRKGGDDDEKSDDEDDVAARFKGFGCQNNPKCLELLRRSGCVHKQWWIKYGYRYKGSKEVPSNDVKDCLDKCKNSDKCFVFSWTNDQKCLVQDDGDTDLKPDNLENADGTLTFLGKVKKLLRFRKFGKQPDYDEEEHEDDDSEDGDNEDDGVTGGGKVTGGGGEVTGGGVVTGGGGEVTGGGTGVGLGLESELAPGNLVSLGGVGGHSKLKFKELGCRRNPFCLKLVKNVRAVRRYWRFKFGFFYKGLKELAAKDIKECVESCQFSPSCFVTTWTEDNKCYVQQDGDVNLKPDNLEVRPNALTFLARMRLLNRFRLTGSDQDTGSDDNDSGDDSHSGDHDHSGDAATKFGGLGCQGNLLCSKLFRKVGLGKLRKWRLKYGSFYKGLKEVPAKDARDCVESCQFHLKCFVASWTEDNKCHIQQDGDGKLNPANLETRPNAYTFLGRKNRLLRYRKGRVGHSGDKDISKDIARKTGGFGCQNDQNCWDLLKLVGRARKLYKVRFGILYKGLIEVPAKDIKECVDNCGSNEKCFVLSWTEDKKCHLQQDGNGMLNQGNFEPNKNTLTLVGKTKHLQRFRKFGRKGDDDEKSDDDDDVAARFKGFGCQNNPKCLELLRRSGCVHKQWWIKYGYRYKGSKEVPSNDVKDCLDKCKNSDKCFVFSWTNDQKCLVQDDGDTDLKPDNLENADGTLTFLGKVKKLLRFRKFGKQPDYDEAEHEDDDIDNGDNEDDGFTGADEVTGDEVTGDEVTGDEVTGDEVTGDEVTGDEVTGDEVTGDEVTGDEVTGVEVTGDEVTGDEVTGDKVTGVEVTGDEVTGDEVTGDEVTGDEVTGDEVTGDETVGVGGGSKSKTIINGQVIIVCFLEVENANYNDTGMVSVDQPTYESCRDYCDNDLLCKVASFRPNSNPKCWSFSGDSIGSLSDLKQENDVNTFIKADCKAIEEFMKSGL